MSAMVMQLPSIERESATAVAFEDFVHDPVMLRPRARQIFVVDRRDVSRGRRFQVLGVGLIATFVSLAIFGWINAWLRGFEGLLLAAIVVSVSVVLWVRGAMNRSTKAVSLAFVDANRREIRLRADGQATELYGGRVIEFDDIDEILFALRPTDAGTNGKLNVKGAGVFVREFDGTVWPIIPSTLAHEQAFAVAMRVAQLVGVGVKQVGAGWRDM